MTLSVLIPSYRFDCTPLVQRLVEMLPDDAEIVVGDDGSPDAERYLTVIETLPRVRVIRQRPNRGSAAMRNRLAREAEGDYLLYIDSDGMPVAADFLQRYMAQLPTDGVVCGSVRHPDTLPSADVSLRWAYEKRAERRFTAERCNRQPYQSFRTFNYLVPRCVMLAHPFDETIQLSGYEDVLLGKTFHDGGIPVRHIENDVMNLDIETNAVFFMKAKRQLQTLHDKRAELCGYSSLLALYERLHRLHLAPVLRLWHRLMQGVEERLLFRRHPSIPLFQLYRLGYYAQLAARD